MKLKVLFAVLFIWKCGFSQSHHFHISGVPNYTTKSQVINPSPAEVYGTKTFGFETKFLYNYVAKSKLGLLLDLNAGLLKWNYYFLGTSSAFGANGGNEMIGWGSMSSDFHYIGATTGLSYDATFKRQPLHAEIGLTIKTFPLDIYGDQEGIYFNRQQPFDPDDPNAGPPDFQVVIPPTKGNIYPTIYLSLSYPIQVSKHSALLFGITKNWGRTLEKGSLQVQYNNQLYYGEYNPRISYLGLDIRYRYSWRKK